MDDTLLLALVVAAGVGIIATLVMLRRQRLESSPPETPITTRSIPVATNRVARPWTWI